MTKKSTVPERLRRQVRERAQGRCEYCLIHESDMYYPHEADHVIAEKHGGRTSLFFAGMACACKGKQTHLGLSLLRL